MRIIKYLRSSLSYGTPYRDQATYEKIQKHLADINDKITDEDMRRLNIKCESEPINTTINQEFNLLKSSLK